MATISGAFRGSNFSGSSLNLGEGLTGPSGTAQRSQGGTAIDSLPLQPSLNVPWSINGWTIGFDLWAFAAGGAQQMYGRFGNIYGGLCTSGQTAGLHGVQPVLPFPPNASLITQIWDGDQSPAPPIAPPGAGGAGFPGLSTRISSTFPLPQPEIVQPGDQLSVALWITPSVTSNIQLVIFNATWSIVYDERFPSTPSSSP